jgi:hypothetical protein
MCVKFVTCSNFPLLCNITSSLRQNFEPWRDVEPQVEMPVTMSKLVFASEFIYCPISDTVRKAIEIGMNVVMERRKREAKNIKQSKLLALWVDPEAHFWAQG